DVAGDNQVEPAVAVVVEERRRHAPAAARDLCSGGDVLKVAGTVVPVQRIAVVAGDVQIGEPVVVVVAHGRAHAVAAGADAVDAGGARDVGERAVVVVA